MSHVESNNGSNSEFTVDYDNFLLLISCGEKEIIELSSDEALNKFYSSEVAEDQLQDPLILAGDKVVPLVLSEIKNKDMPRRRYAIGALGSIGNPLALPVLEGILNDGFEKDYFQCDALEAIAMIDFNYAKKLAKINLDSSSDCMNWLGTDI